VLYCFGGKIYFNDCLQSGSQNDFFFLRLEKAGAHAVFKLRWYVQQHANTK